MKDPKVLVICESFTAGCKRHILDILSGVHKEAFDITLAVPPGMSPSGNTTTPQKTVGCAMQRGFSPRRLRESVKNIRKLLLDIRPDILHLHSFFAGLYGRMALADISYKPVVLYSPHAPAFLRPGMQGYVALQVERFLSRRTDMFVAVSEGEREVLHRYLSVPVEKIFLLKNAVEPRNFGNLPTPPAPTVGAMGRFVRQKGFEYLIEAAAVVVKTHPQTRFIIAGAGPLKHKYLRMMKRLGIEDHVEIACWTSPRNILAVSSIFAIPSLWEGLPYVLLEAMAASRAVIASDIPGISETLDGCGILVKPASAISIAHAVRTLLEDDSLRKKYADQAALRIREHHDMKGFHVRANKLYALASTLRTGTP